MISRVLFSGCRPLPARFGSSARGPAGAGAAAGRRQALGCSRWRLGRAAWWWVPRASPPISPRPKKATWRRSSRPAPISSRRPATTGSGWKVRTRRAPSGCRPMPKLLDVAAAPRAGQLAPHPPSGAGRPGHAARRHAGRRHGRAAGLSPGGRGLPGRGPLGAVARRPRQPDRRRACAAAAARPSAWSGTGCCARWRRLSRPFDASGRRDPRPAGRAAGRGRGPAAAAAAGQRAGARGRQGRSRVSWRRAGSIAPELLVPTAGALYAVFYGLPEAVGELRGRRRSRHPALPHLRAENSGSRFPSTSRWCGGLLSPCASACPTACAGRPPRC